jgi:hypothetical protein
MPYTTYVQERWKRQQQQTLSGWTADSDGMWWWSWGIWSSLGVEPWGEWPLNNKKAAVNWYNGSAGTNLPPPPYSLPHLPLHSSPPKNVASCIATACRVGGGGQQQQALTFLREILGSREMYTCLGNSGATVTFHRVRKLGHKRGTAVETRSNREVPWGSQAGWERYFGKSRVTGMLHSWGNQE